MRDLKQCLIDLLRTGGLTTTDTTNSITGKQINKSKLSQKPKKLYEYTVVDCNADLMRKYNNIDTDGGGAFNNSNSIIYFNENLTMTSKYNVRRYPLHRYFSYPVSSYSNSDDSISPQSSKSGNHITDDGESGHYDYSSDDDRDTLVDSCDHNSTKNRKTKMPQLMCNIEDNLDSLCTLCTSSFSYNNCCSSSQCSSTCNSDIGSYSSRDSQFDKCQRNKHFLNLR